MIPMWMALTFTGWMAAITFLSLWLSARSGKHAYLTSGEARQQQTTLLRREGLRLLESAAWHELHECSATAHALSVKAHAMLAEADQLDPPVPPGGEPGRLSLISPPTPIESIKVASSLKGGER
jgi:hypothetical protein